MIVPRGSPASVAVIVDLDARAEAPQDVEQAGPRRVQPDVLDLDREPGSAAAATSQNAADEKSPGTDERLALQTLAAVDRDGQAVDVRRVTPNAVSARSV